MIPKESFIALSLLMAVSLAFGYLARVLLDKASQSLTEPDNEPQQHTCDTCLHGKTRPQDEPCCYCLMDDDIDMWEER